MKGPIGLDGPKGEPVSNYLSNELDINFRELILNKMAVMPYYQFLPLNSNLIQNWCIEWIDSDNNFSSSITIKLSVVLSFVSCWHWIDALTFPMIYLCMGYEGLTFIFLSISSISLSFLWWYRDDQVKKVIKATQETPVTIYYRHQRYNLHPI